MNDFLAPPGITRAALDSALAGKITDPESDTSGALNATYATNEIAIAMAVALGGN